jgi:hypothetical protein
LSRKPDAWPGDEPDWYGEKAKRKNDQPVNNARLWGFVSILASLAVIVAGCAIITVILANPFNQRDALINTPVPSITSVAVVPSATPFPRPTLEPTLPIPTAARTSLTAMTLGIYEQNGVLLWSLYGTAWPPGYVLRGLNWTHGAQFVAQTQALNNAPCSVTDTFLDIATGRNALPTFGRIVNPKAILVQGDWTIILATDCTRQGAALFLFDLNKTLQDVFPIIGGDALIEAEGRIFVALSGFAGGDQQYHWIELKITDDPSPKLAQVDQYALDDVDAVYRSAAYHSGVGLAYIRAKPGLEMLQIAELKENLLTVRKTITLPISLTDLHFSNAGELYALDRRNKSVVKFDSDPSVYRAIPLTGINPYSFTLTTDDKFVIAGYP